MLEATSNIDYRCEYGLFSGVFELRENSKPIPNPDSLSSGETVVIPEIGI
jgi:hypothetical protein